MTTREMHIEIQQSTQQIAANRSRKFLSQEIDWILNKMQDRYVQSCLRPRTDGSGGFQLDQSGADKIRTLIKSETLPVYTIGIDKYKAMLPGDYLYLVDDWSNTVDLCGAPVPEKVTTSLTLHKVTQTLTPKASAPFYETFSLKSTDTTLLDVSALGMFSQYSTYPVQDKFDVSDFINHIIVKGKGKVHWERYDSLDFPNTYLIEMEAPFILLMDGNETTSSIEVVWLQKESTILPGTKVSNRLTGSDVISSLQQSAHYKSSHYSPISELQNQNLIIYRDSSFIVSTVGVSYVRKPRPISLSLGTDCELPVSAQQTICDLATEYIKGRTENVQGKELATQDLTTRVVL